jgi:hypothetical protein
MVCASFGWSFSRIVPAPSTHVHTLSGRRFFTAGLFLTIKTKDCIAYGPAEHMPIDAHSSELRLAQSQGGHR